MCIDEDTYHCFFEKSIGILSIPVIWYNRVMAYLKDKQHSSVDLYHEKPVWVKTSEFFVLVERAFWYPWFGDLTSQFNSCGWDIKSMPAVYFKLLLNYS